MTRKGRLAYLRGIDEVVETTSPSLKLFDRILEDEDAAEAAAPIIVDPPLNGANASREIAPPQQMTSALRADGTRVVNGGGKPLNGSLLVPFYDDGLPPKSPPKPTRILKSELPDVSDAAWTNFVLGMKTASVGAVSASNALGAFEIKPRRLADLGLMRNTFCTRSPTGRMVWIGEFVSREGLPRDYRELLGQRPFDQKTFLSDAKVQYCAFSDSMRRYLDDLRAGKISKPDGGKPDGMTLSGALAVLHRCGPSGLKTWNDEGNRFPDTAALFEQVNGVF